jgi:hypothetical protein
MLNETILIIIDNDKMFPKISVLIRKNSHEVMKVITNNYKKCAKWQPLLSIQ